MNKLILTNKILFRNKKKRNLIKFENLIFRLILFKNLNMRLLKAYSNLQRNCKNQYFLFYQLLSFNNLNLKLPKITLSLEFFLKYY
jgi:hypothetical protein